MSDQPGYSPLMSTRHFHVQNGRRMFFSSHFWMILCEPLTHLGREDLSSAVISEIVYLAPTTILYSKPQIPFLPILILGLNVTTGLDSCCVIGWFSSNNCTSTESSKVANGCILPLSPIVQCHKIQTCQTQPVAFTCVSTVVFHRSGCSFTRSLLSVILQNHGSYS